MRSELSDSFSVGSPTERRLTAVRWRFSSTALIDRHLARRQLSACCGRPQHRGASAPARRRALLGISAATSSWRPQGEADGARPDAH